MLVQGRGKLEAQADAVFFVGYDRRLKGFRVYWPGKRALTCERDLRWDEHGPLMLEGESHMVNQQELPRHSAQAETPRCQPDSLLSRGAIPAHEPSPKIRKEIFNSLPPGDLRSTTS